jgi:hypothetical protein
MFLASYKKESTLNQRVKCVSLLAVAFAMTVLASPSAEAQANVSAGYQFGHVSADGFGENYPGGWYVDASAVVLPMVAVVGQVGGIYKSVDGVTAHAYDFLGGVRVLATAVPRVTPFAQVLVGGVNAGGGGSSSNAFSLELGGGLDFKAVPGIGLRIGVDYRRDFYSASDGGADNVVAVVLGVVFGGK